MDYRRQAILTRSKSGKFERRVDACQVVGAAVESSLKLAYRPQVGLLPVPLAFQQPVHIPRVSLRDVLPPGFTRAKASEDVQVGCLQHASRKRVLGMGAEGCRLPLVNGGIGSTCTQQFFHSGEGRLNDHLARDQIFSGQSPGHTSTRGLAQSAA